MQVLDHTRKSPSEISSQPAIQTIGLTKQFKRVTAVKQVELVVQPGDIFGLLGPNGAGKTTIIRILLGLVKPTSGKAEIFGFDVTSQRKEVLQRLSAMVESPALYPGLTGRDNLRALALYSGIANPNWKIEEVLNRVGLATRAKDRFETYSLGMKQRLYLAAALLNEPQLIILDEPTNGLDPAGMAEFRQLIKELAQEGHTIFLSSHLLFEVQQICNRVAIIQRGEIIVQGVVKELLTAQASVYVKVTPTELPTAWRILESNGLAGRLKMEGDYLSVDLPTAETGTITRLLATHNIFLAELTPHQQSLEEFYLKLTEGQVAKSGGNHDN
ncbi:MAG: ABC transporter ATP-binding protein [Chloroflexota bacterium]|nr:ABC transporter ATP-binding protein [Chloroflexota bacterium]